MQHLIGEIAYCEQGLRFFFSQPLNAISNVAFLIVAFILYKSLGKTRHPVHLVFVALIFLTGIGSFLYHGFQNQITLFLDVVPLSILFIFVVYILLKDIIYNKKIFIFMFSLFIIIELIIPFIVPRGFLNGSTRYLVGLITLMFCYPFLQKKHKEYVRLLQWAIGSFSVAIFFKSIDNVLCSKLPIGTHFIWHMFAALTVYFIVVFTLRTNIR